MDNYATPIANLIEQFAKLPGIGRKTAQRLAYYVLEMDEVDVELLSTSIRDAKDKIQLCDNCCNLTEDKLCNICKSSRRDESTICVVEGAKDIIAMERSKEY